MVDPHGNWSISGTKQWSKDEMEWLAKTQGSELATTFAPIADPWLHMGAIAELILHDDVDRARAFTQGLIQQSPEAQTGLTQYFGDALVAELLRENTVA